jgi:hypothetical protein
VLEIGGLRLAVVGADEPVHRDGDVGRVGRVADLRPRVAVRAAVLRPVLGGAAQDAEEQRHAQLDRAPHRLRAAA